MTQKNLLLRLLMFLGFFVLVSGVIGSWLVPTRLLYGFGFYLYGNLGKMVILSVIMFGLLAKDKLKTIRIFKWKWAYLIYLLDVLVLIPLFFYLAGLLLDTKSLSENLPLTFITHFVLITIPLFLFLGIFGFKFLVTFMRQFKKEIGICIALSIVFDVAIFQVWKLWPVLSGGVLMTVKFLLSLTYPKVIHILPLTLIVGHFSVSIMQACSGLDSLFMFTALYGFIGLVDYKKFNLTRLIIWYFPAALGMYFINILRVYLLIVIGVSISPELAIKLFHTYAGMILFICYFGLFWKFAYKRIMLK